MNSDAPIEIHYWKIRGLLEPIKTLCEYLHVDYNLKYKEDRNAWLEESKKLRESGFQYPNLPYINDNSFLVSETMAILIHIAKKFNSKLTFNDDEVVEFFQKWGVVSDFKGFVTRPCYTSADKEDLKQNLSGNIRIHNKIETLASILTKQNYIMNKGITVIDFFLAEAVEMCLIMEKELNIDIFTMHRKIFETYLNNLLENDNIKEYRRSERFLARPFNNMLFAKWG